MGYRINIIRPILAVIGLPPLVILGGLVYSTAFIRSNHYGAYIFFCIVYGFFCYLLFLLSRCVRSSALLWVPILIIAWTGPFVVGHYYGYTDTKYIVWRLVQADTDGQFVPEWKHMDRDQVFDCYVQSITGNSLGGFPAYLSLMAYEGWSGFETTRGVYIRIERRGIWVWIAWVMHLVFLLVATAAAMGATIPDENIRANAHQSVKKKKTIPALPKVPEKQQPQRNQGAAGGAILTVVKPENELEQNGWWLINVSFKGREASFRAYYSDTQPTGRAFFEDIRHALYRLKSEGPLAALAVSCSVEGGLTAKEAIDQLMNDDRKIRYVLDSYYKLFENDDKFFSEFF